MEQLIKEQKEEFEKRFELEPQGCSECSGYELIDNNEIRYPRGNYHCEYDLDHVWDWHKKSMKAVLEKMRKDIGEYSTWNVYDTAECYIIGIIEKL